MATDSIRLPSIGLRVCTAMGVVWLAGCSQRDAQIDDRASSEKATVYDTTAAKPIEPQDRYERLALKRGVDFKLIDRLVDPKTPVPDFEREPLPALPPDARIAEGLWLLDDTNPFPDAVPLAPKEVTITVAVARSTYRTRTREEVLSAVQPFIDIVQREVNIRGAPSLRETAEESYFALLDGRDQMAISHVFDYLLVRRWFQQQEGNGTVLLGYARPANPRSTDLDRNRPGLPGTSIELVVAQDAPYKTFADLKGTRLTLAANDIHGPGTFLTRLLADLNHPADQRFFSKVTLRRYTKDTVLDLLKNKADVACVDQGTMGALDRFYGLGLRVRTLAISPRYNRDVLFTSLNNLETNRTEIELTQRQLNTLDKDPEGQEVLFFFDTEGWYNFREGDIAVPRAHFDDFVRFIDQTPIDLQPLLDPDASVDRQTYDRFGDE